MAEGEFDSPMPAPGDDAIRLSRAVARGDRAALAEFYERWFDRCHAGARRMTGRDEAFCLDVVQDAMLRVIKSIRPMRSDAELEGWMAAVVRSSALDLLRKESRRAARERGQPAPGAVDGPSHEEVQWAMRAVGELEMVDQSLLADRFGRGRTLDEAARDAGISGAAAHGRIRRVMHRLRLLAKEVFDE